jgi:hypothetical protein|uniref:Uncharacterized protein n=1 Tax=viral metagenome TaxID=1070528 RepID=A0A6C0IJ21_9ZZZZ
MHKPLAIFIFVALLSFANDKFHSDCNNPSIKVDLVSVLHHFVSIYSWFGSLILGYPEVHLFYVLAIIAGWNIFGNCIISEWYNNACELDKNQNHKDIPYYIMSYITNKERQSYDYLIYIVVSIDIMMIIRKYNLISF